MSVRIVMFIGLGDSDLYKYLSLFLYTKQTDRQTDLMLGYAGMLGTL
jgi:hypothetical protein